MAKIGVHLRKLLQIKTRTASLDHSVHCYLVFLFCLCNMKLNMICVTFHKTQKNLKTLLLLRTFEF